jgi:uncharacterized protein involved in exopolysaccharide biosynthesis
MSIENSKIELTPEELKRIIASNQFDNSDDEIDLAELWSGLTKRKGMIVLVTLVFALLAIYISLSMTPKYQSTVKMLPVSSEGGASLLMDKYGGLASLAGVTLDSGGELFLLEQAVEVLNSRQFLAEFIRENNLKQVLFYKNWDQQSQQWIKQESVAGKIKEVLGGNANSIQSYDGQEPLLENEPSIYEVVEFFKKEVLSISSDKNSLTYNLSIKWVNPVQARDWANQLVKRVDERLRNDNLQQAQATIDYMNEKLATIELQDIRNIALKTIEENLKKITFAQVQKEYVFKVIDPAIVEEKPVSPKRGLMVAVGVVLGLMLGVFLALVLNWRTSNKVA